MLDVAIGDYNADLQKLSEAAEINVTKAIAQAKIMKIGKWLLMLCRINFIMIVFREGRDYIGRRKQ